MNFKPLDGIVFGNTIISNYIVNGNCKHFRYEKENMTKSNSLEQWNSERRLEQVNEKRKKEGTIKCWARSLCKQREGTNNVIHT